MNALELLHDAVLGELDEWSTEHSVVEHILDTFISQWEPVEVARHRNGRSFSIIPDRADASAYARGYGDGPFTILVPRTQEPTLLEAARATVEAIRPWRGGVRHGCFEDFDTAFDALSQAIKREQEK